MQKKILLFFFIISTAWLSAQQQPAFDKNIDLPEESGGFAFDMVYANNKLFVHAQSKIFVYNESDNSLLNVIDLMSNENGGPFTEHNYGKYAPPYFNYHFYSPSRQTMVLNESLNLIYTITPDLNLISIKTTGDYDVTTLYTTPTVIDHFRISSGRVIIKYDPLNERLYFLLSGRDEANHVGSFHLTDSYFAIYDVNEFNGSLDFICDEYKRGFDSFNGQTGDGYASTAIEIEYNHHENGSNLFYIARINKLELWELTGVSNNPKVQLDYQEIPEGKIGKLFTIKDGNLHKIIALPYRLPGDGGGYEPDIEDDPPVNFYVIEGNSTTLIYDPVIAPSKRVIDAVFLPNNNTLAMTFAVDMLINDVNLINDGSDIAFYEYVYDNALSKWVFEPNYDLDLATNAYPQYQQDQPHYYNYPLKIMPGRNSDFFVGKINEVIHVTYVSGGEPYYISTQVIDKSGSFFIDGEFTPNSIYFTSLTGNGFYDIEQTTPTLTQCGFPVYKSVYNPANHCLYFYNTLGSQNGIFRYSLSDNLIKEFIEVEAPIGDMVFNPYTEHILISLNTVGFGKIKRLKPDNYFEANLGISVGNHITQMFISPNGLLCFLANTKSADPRLVVYDATEYTLKDQMDIDIGLYSETNFCAYFCYNPYNNTIYSTVSIAWILSNPYLSMKNACENDMHNGSLLSVSETGVIDEIEIQGNLLHPKRIICPEVANPQPGYQGYLWIHGGAYVDNISYFDCANETIETAEFISSIYINDIAYDNTTNSLLAFSDQYISPPPPSGYSNDHVARFYRIEKVGNEFEKYEIGYYEGQIAAFFTNPYDGMLYVHTKFDENKFGDEPSMLLQYDPLSTNNNFNLVDLGLTSYYVDYDYFKDGLYSLKNYNLTTPYIDPYNYKMYLPNGAHSVVSVVDFEATEELVLNNNEWAWLSFPRMERTGNQAVVVNDVLLGNIEPNNFMEESKLVNLPPQYNVIDINEWTGTSWSPSGYLYDIKSSLGYKLNLLYDPQPEVKLVELHGNVLDPIENVNIYENYDNWVGYWLYQSQSPFDAIPAEVLDELTSIKAQSWYCVKQWNYPDGNPVPYWVCGLHQDDLLIEYGDMVILKTDLTMDFQWQLSGGSSKSELKQETEYYEFTEEADYISFMIELDTTENPQEIGAFIGDSCIGASTVLPEDTIVLVPGYTEGINGDVVFQEYYGSQKSTMPVRNEYLVRYNTPENWKKRTINTNERKPHYFVSFKSQIEELETENQSLFSIYPNPASDVLNINYEVLTESKVDISVYDSFGRSIATILNTEENAGVYNIQWDIRVNKLTKGLYIIKLKLNDEVYCRKVVIN